MLTYYFLGSIAGATGGSSLFFFDGAEPPDLAGLKPKAANDPEKTEAMKVGSKSKIF